eukprot:2910023-Rhodomonas_salina.2
MVLRERALPLDRYQAMQSDRSLVPLLSGKYQVTQHWLQSIQAFDVLVVVRALCAANRDIIITPLLRTI